MFKLMLLILIKCNIFSWNYRMCFLFSPIHFNFTAECFLCFLRQFNPQFWEKLYSSFIIFQSFNSTTYMHAFSWCFLSVCVFMCLFLCQPAARGSNHSFHNTTSAVFYLSSQRWMDSSKNIFRHWNRSTLYCYFLTLLLWYLL